MINLLMTDLSKTSPRAGDTYLTGRGEKAIAVCDWPEASQREIISRNAPEDTISRQLVNLKSHCRDVPWLNEKGAKAYQDAVIRRLEDELERCKNRIFNQRAEIRDLLFRSPKTPRDRIKLENELERLRSGLERSKFIGKTYENAAKEMQSKIASTGSRLQAIINELGDDLSEGAVAELTTISVHLLTYQRP